MRPRLTYANVVATLALVVAVGGGAAYAANTVFSSDIVDGQVKTPDLANGAVANAKLAGGAVTSEKVIDDNLKSRDVLDNTLRGVDIDESTLSNVGGGGPAGGDLTGIYPNPEIANHVVGASELEFFTVVDETTSVPPNGGVGTVTASCPEGTQLISGGAFFPFPSGDVSASSASNFSPGAWNAQGQNNGNAEQNLLARAFCLQQAP